MKSKEIIQIEMNILDEQSLSKYTCIDKLNDVELSEKDNVDYVVNVIRDHKKTNIVKRIKEVDWLLEIIKAILTGFIILLVSTTTLGIISFFSPGEYSGIRLRKYLLETVADELGIEYSEEGISISRSLYGIQNGINVQDIIVLCGEYYTDPSTIDSYLDGHYICIFEREQRDFFNDLFRTEPKYIPTFIRISDKYSNFPGGLSCISCESIDIDGDGLQEIYIQYQSSFADRISQMSVILEQTDTQWKIISPDLSTVEDEVYKIAKKDIYVSIDKFLFLNPQKPDDKKEILYGLSNQGYILTTSNPYTGGIDWLYCIAVRHEVEGIRYINYAFVMEQFAGKGLIREPDWNVGSVYFPQYEDREIDEFVKYLWGWSPHIEYNVPWIN